MIVVSIGSGKKAIPLINPVIYPQGGRKTGRYQVGNTGYQYGISGNDPDDHLLLTPFPHEHQAGEKKGQIG